MNVPETQAPDAGGEGAGAGSAGPAAQDSERLDSVLVRLGLARSRGHAKDLVTGGEVTLDDRVVTRAGMRLKNGDRPVVALNADEVADPVGRGAAKLLAAFAAWQEAGWGVSGARCLDVGASTGGFTQVLLAHGAAQVVALDVGHEQLAQQLAVDPRVTDLPGTNIRDVGQDELGGPFDAVVVDLSFISLTLVLPTVVLLLKPGGQAVLLVKPQFEVGRGRLTKSGVVRRRGDRLAALLRVIEAVWEAGADVRDIVHSPVAGAAGNREYLVWVWSPPAGLVTKPQVEHARWGRMRDRAALVVGEED